MKNPLVSIIVPVYNAENYICECVDSILSQTYKNIEVLLINDGSKDNSDSLIKSHYGTEPRVIYINKHNEGVSKTRNFGIERANGVYLTFVDADDWIEKSFIDEAVVSLEKYNLDFVLGGTEKVYSNRSEKYVANTTKDILIYKENIGSFIARVLSNGVVNDSELITCFTSGPVCKLFRKDIISEIRFDENLFLGEDTVFNLKILEQTCKIGVIPHIWYYYRMNENSVTKIYNPSIQTYTERLLIVLSNMYYDNGLLRPYLLVRGVQQFHGMLLLYPMNKKSKMDFFEQRNFVKKCYDNDIWSKLFQKINVNSLPASGFDKVLMWLCIHRLSGVTILWVRTRLIVKNILSKK